MFVFLAVIFGLGYVIFNVGGSIPGTGLGDVLQGLAQTGDTGPSVGESEDKIKDRPNDPSGYRELSTALQREQRNQEAIAPLERYVQMRPSDREALRELGSLHMAQASTRSRVRATRSSRAHGGDVLRPGTWPVRPDVRHADHEASSLQQYSSFLGAQQSYEDATRVFNKLVAVTRRLGGRRAADLPPARQAAQSAGTGRR
jgi:tetratricopeptide (TPR) repeat protein